MWNPFRWLFGAKKKQEKLATTPGVCGKATVKIIQPSVPRALPERTSTRPTLRTGTIFADDVIDPSPIRPSRDEEDAIKAVSHGIPSEDWKSPTFDSVKPDPHHSLQHVGGGGGHSHDSSSHHSSSHSDHSSHSHDSSSYDSGSSSFDSGGSDGGGGGD